MLVWMFQTVQAHFSFPDGTLVIPPTGSFAAKKLFFFESRASGIDLVARAGRSLEG